MLDQSRIGQTVDGLYNFVLDQSVRRPGSGRTTWSVDFHGLHFSIRYSSRKRNEATRNAWAEMPDHDTTRER